MSKPGAKLSPEESLLATGKWALFYAQLSSYVPLSTRKINSSGSSLHFKWLSYQVGHSVILQSVLLLRFLNFATTFLKFLLEKNESTDGFVFAAWDALLIFSIGFLRVHGVIRVRKSLIFWKRIVSVFTKLISVTERNFHQHYHHLENQLSNFLRTWALIYFLISIFHLLSTGFAQFQYICFGNYYPENTISQARYSKYEFMSEFTAFSLELQGCLHLGNTLWMIFFIKFFYMSFSVLSSELRTISCPHDSHNMKIVCPVVRGESNNSQKLLTTRVKVGCLEVLSMSCTDSSGDQEQKTFNSDSEKLCHILDLINSLEEEINNFNQHFAVDLIIETIFGLTNIIFGLYTTYTRLSVRVPISVHMTLLFPFVAHGLNLFLLCTSSSNMVEAIYTLLKNLQNIPLQKYNLNLQLKVPMIVSRLSINPPTISAGCFFKISGTLLTSATGALITYILVLFQFRVSENCPEAKENDGLFNLTNPLIDIDNYYMPTLP